MSSVTSSQWIFLAIVFAAVFGVGALVLYVFMPDPTRTRVRGLALEGAPLAPDGDGRLHWIERIVQMTGPLARLSVPEEGWERSALRIRFMNAGFRHPAAFPVICFPLPVNVTPAAEAVKVPVFVQSPPTVISPVP